MLETVGQTVADEGDMVAGFKVRDDNGWAWTTIPPSNEHTRAKSLNFIKVTFPNVLDRR